MFFRFGTAAAEELILPYDHRHLGHVTQLLGHRARGPGLTSDTHVSGCWWGVTSWFGKGRGRGRRTEVRAGVGP